MQNKDQKFEDLKEDLIEVLKIKGFNFKFYKSCLTLKNLDYSNITDLTDFVLWNRYKSKIDSKNHDFKIDLKELRYLDLFILYLINRYQFEDLKELYQEIGLKELIKLYKEDQKFIYQYKKDKKAKKDQEVV